MAAAIQFRFPECPKIPLGTLITRASSQGLQLMSDLMSWDPDKRPNSQQTQRYPYFQNIKLNNSGQNRTNQMLQQNNSVQSGRLSIMEVDALEKNGLLSRFSLNPKFNNSNNEMNDLNSLISVSRLSHNPSEKQFVIDNNHTNSTKNADSVNNSAKTVGKLQNGINYNILNDMFSNINMKSDTNNNKDHNKEKIVRTENNDVKEQNRKEVNVENLGKIEKINDVYINLAKESNEGIFQATKVPNDKSLAKNTGFVLNSKGFFLHEPKPLINGKSISENNLNDNNKIYNMFSKQSNNGSFDDGLLDVLSVPKSNMFEKNTSLDKNQKWGESFEEDELASILG